MKKYFSYKKISKGCLFIIGVFLLALCYNLFFLPNNLVIGGTTGLAIITQKYLNPTLFIYVSTFILLIISFIFLGKKDTKKTIIGSILYPLFISLTKPLALFLIPYLVFEDYLFTILLAGLLYGLSSGIIFKTGYTTGGSDVIIKLLTKYLKIQEGKSTTYTNGTIILLGGLVLGFPKVVYASIILVISTYLIDKIMIGISNSKVFYIYTKEIEKVKDVILQDLKIGYTIFPTIGGYSHTKGEMIMCVVPTKKYYLLKELVLAVDLEAFFVINDCYDVNGGVKKKNLPFS